MSPSSHGDLPLGLPITVGKISGSQDSFWLQGILGPAHLQSFHEK